MRLRVIPVGLAAFVALGATGVVFAQVIDGWCELEDQRPWSDRALETLDDWIDAAWIWAFGEVEAGEGAASEPDPLIDVINAKLERCSPMREHLQQMGATTCQGVKDALTNNSELFPTSGSSCSCPDQAPLLLAIFASQIGYYGGGPCDATEFEDYCRQLNSRSSNPVTISYAPHRCEVMAVPMDENDASWPLDYVLGNSTDVNDERGCHAYCAAFANQVCDYTSGAPFKVSCSFEDRQGQSPTRWHDVEPNSRTFIHTLDTPHSCTE